MKQREVYQAERKFWGDLAVSQKPEFWISVTLRKPYSDRESIEALAFGMRALQRRIPSNRALRGVAVLERTWKNTAFAGCLHMHALIWGADANLRNPDTYVPAAVRTAFGKLRDERGRPMTTPKTIDIRRVYDPAGVVDYETKDLGKSESRRSRLWLITAEGFDRTTDYFL